MIEGKKLKELMVAETIKLSGFVPRRGELHMSWLWMKKEDIIERVLYGESPSDEMKVKFYQGNLGEWGMVERLKNICVNEGWVINEGIELRAFDGNLTGHTDCEIQTGMERVLIECKTVPDDEALFASTKEQRYGVPYRVYTQVQGYMCWGEYDKAIVIYESRATGKLWMVEILPDVKMQEDLADKALKVLQDTRVKQVMYFAGTDYTEKEKQEIMSAKDAKI